MTREQVTRTLYWLSFVDRERPQGARSLGVSIVIANSFAKAIDNAWHTGCNPGGEVQGMALPPEFSAKVPDAYIGRLLNNDEREALEAIIEGLH